MSYVVPIFNPWMRILKADFNSPQQLTEILEIVKSKPGLTQAFWK
jgi:hypothetical protein